MTVLILAVPTLLAMGWCVYRALLEWDRALDDAFNNRKD